MKRTGKLIVLLSTVVCLITLLFAVSTQSSAATSISAATVSSIGTQTYTGRAVVPAVTVKYGSRVLTKGTNYTVTYKNNINVGIANVVITGRGAYSGTKTVQFYIVSPAVKSLAFKNPKQTSVYLYWTASPKATGYQVWKYDTVARSYKLARATAVNAVNLTGLTAGSTNVVRVRPYNKLSNGRYVYGAFCSAIKAMTAPENVTGVTQSAAKATTASITWKASAGADGYQVYFFNEDTGRYVIKSTLTANSAAFTGLAPSSSTKVIVRAFRKINGATCVSSFSAVAALNTLPENDVTDIQGKAYTNYVTLTWNEVENASLYRIYQLKNNVWTAVALTDKNTAEIKNLASGADFNFRVVTCVQSGSRYFNGAVKASCALTTIPEKVSGITYTATGSSITLKWKAINATAFQIYQLDKATGEYVRYANSSSAACTVKGLSKLTGYSFKIRAYYKNAAGEFVFGEFSDVFTAQTTELITGIKLDKTILNLGVNEKAAIAYQVLPSTAYSSGVTFLSSKPGVATVNAYGLITAVASGTTIITVTSRDDTTIRTACTVTVTSVAAQSISLPSSLTIYVGQTYKVNPTFYPENTSNKAFSIKFSDNSYGLIFKTNYPASQYIGITGGYIKGLKATGAKTSSSNAGPFTMTVTTQNGKTATCSITVISGRSAVTGIKVYSATDTWYPGQTGTLSTVITPSTATDQSVTWSSSNNNIATVDSNGKVLAISQGTANITVTTNDGKYKAVYTVNVQRRIAPASVTINKESLEMIAGTTSQLSAVVLPSNANSTSVQWTTSNRSVASVSSTGLVTAISNGSAVITATADGGLKATCNVWVGQKRITLTPGTFFEKLSVGSEIQLTATVFPSALGQSFMWSSSDQKVATVTSDGLVTIVGEGGAFINVTCVADNTLKTYASVSTTAYVMPDVSTADSLVSEFSKRLNKIKMYDLPAFSLVSTVDFKNVTLKNPSALVDNSTFASLFEDFAEDETKTMPAVAQAESYSTARSEYWNSIPVKGYSNNIIAGIDKSLVNMSRSGIKDSGSTYTMTLTLNPENFTTLPQRTDNPNHGKIFDILYKDYIDQCMSQLKSIQTDGLSVSMSFNSFGTKYHDCCVTITVDKATNKVIKAVYDMNVLVSIGSLKMNAVVGIIPMSLIDSDVSFDVNSHTNIDFMY